MGGGGIGCKLPWVAYKPSYAMAWPRHGASHACPLGYFINQYPGTRYTVDDIVVQPSRPQYGCHIRVLSVSGQAAVGSRLVGAVGSRLVGAVGSRLVGAVGSRQPTGQSSRTGSRQERPGSRTEGLC